MEPTAETTRNTTGNSADVGLMRRSQAAFEKGAVVMAPVAGITSFLMLQLALDNDSAVRFLSWIMGGALVGAIALRALSHVVQKFLLSGSATWSWIVGLGAAAVGLTVAWIGVSNESVLLATSGVGVGVLALVVLTETWKGQARGRPEPWLVFGSVLIAIAVLLPATQVVAAVLVGTIGIAALKAGAGGWVSPDVPNRPGRAWHVLLAGMVLVAIAVLVAITASELEAAARVVLLAYAGLSLVVMAITILVADRDGAWKIPLAIGLICGCFGIWILAGLFPNWRGLVLLVAVVGMAAGSFFVFRGEAIVALVLLGALLGWVLVDRTQDWESPGQSAGLIVSLGDSFAAGQGTSEFLPGTNTVAGDADGTCRRSVHAYAFLVGAELAYDVKSLACSGADIDEVAVHEDNEARHVEDHGKRTQLERLDLEAGAQPDLVLTSVGVNDAGFSKVLTACVLPSRCDSRADNILDGVPDIEPSLKEAYLRILREFSDAKVVVVAYPPLIGHDANCGRSMTREEQAFANDYVRRVNTSIESVIAEINTDRLVLFDNLPAAFVRHTLCETTRDQTPGANFFHLLPKSEGPVLKRLGPTNWHSGTGHPNNLGHRCVAQALIHFLASEDLIEPTSGGGQLCELATTDEVAVAEVATDKLIDDWNSNRVEFVDPDFDLETWTGEQIDRLIARSLVALTLLMLAGASTAMAFAPRLRVWPADVLLPEWL